MATWAEARLKFLREAKKRKPCPLDLPQTPDTTMWKKANVLVALSKAKHREVHKP